MAVDGVAALAWPVTSHSPHREPGAVQALRRRPACSSDDNQIFLTLVYAEIERHWNKTPPFEIVPPDPKKTHGGEEYQAGCMEILRWLQAEGDITSLEVSEES